MRTITTVSTSILLASLLLAGCTSPGGIKEKATNQAVAPPDAVIFVSGMS